MSEVTVTLNRTLTITNGLLASGWIPFHEMSYWGALFYMRGDDDAPIGFVVVEHEEGERTEITFDRMREAFVECVNNKNDTTDRLMGYPHDYFLRCVLEAEDGEPEWGEIDGEAADIWIQVAAFGKVVYG